MHIEDSEQIVLMEWAEAESKKRPELSLLFHIPNGGKRNAREAARFKELGVKAGVPDLFLPVPRGKYHGLYIEMKAPPHITPSGKRAKGAVTQNQAEWIKALRGQGYAVEVCYGFEQARIALLKYLDMR